MSVTLTYNNPDLPKGQEVSMAGLSVMLKNGESVTLDDDGLEVFKQQYDKTPAEQFKGDPHIKVGRGGDK